MARGIRVVQYPFQSLNLFQEFLSKTLETKGVSVCRLRPEGIHVLVQQVFKRKTILHLHWIEGICLEPCRVKRACSIFVFLSVCTYFGIRRRLVWTCHNQVPHDSPGSKTYRLVTLFLLFAARTTIVHSAYQKDMLAWLVPSRVEFIPHPSYRPYISTGQRDLGDGMPALNGSLRILVFGMIRPYKGYIELLRQIENYPRELELTIIGCAVDSGYLEELEQAVISSKHNTSLIAKRYLQSELEELARMSDIALFSFEDITSSGSLMMGLTLGLPIVCKYSPFISSYLDSTYAVQYTSDPIDALLGIDNNRERLRRMSKAAAAKAQSMSWDNAINDFLLVYGESDYEQ